MSVDPFDDVVKRFRGVVVDINPDIITLFRVKSFREKPDAATAEKYLQAGNYYWNSGMFVFSLETLASEFAAHSGDVAAPFQGIADKAKLEKGRVVSGVRIWGEGPAFTEAYGKLPSISVDYAIMEKTAKAAMVKAKFEWNDVGSWDEAARLYPDQAPAVFSADSSGNKVFSDIPVALLGVEDLVVVIRNGHALIVKKGSSQLVRDAANALAVKKDKP